MARQIVIDIIGDSKRFTQATGDAVKSTSRFLKPLDDLVKKGGIAGSIMQGVGQSFGQMLNPVSLATRGFGMLTDVMSDGIRAAIEDEKAQAQLNQTIKANVKGWDENTAAIEEAIKAGAQLAFTDDEVRAGLNQLIPRTKDIAEANRLNALAMDLARAKNLSLEEAASLVGKAYSGQASALKRAGIAIKNTKNSTAALAELQNVVAGQADKYASTAEGSMAVLQITIDELVESLGYELLPYLKQFANYLRTDVIPRIDDVTTALHNLGMAAEVSLSFLPRGNDGLSRFNDGLRGMAESLERTSIVVSGTWGASMQQVADDTEPVVASIGDITRVVLDLPNAFTLAVVDMKSRIAEGKKGIIEQFRDLAWQTKHPFAEESYSSWLGRKLEKATQRMKQAAKNGRPGIVAQYRQLREDIMIEMLLLPRSLAALQRRISTILGRVYSAVQTAVGNVFNLGRGGGVEARASGGPVRAGNTYLVGERGPELLTMGGNGHVTPNHAMGGGKAYTINVNVGPGGDMAETGRRVVQAIRAYERRDGKVWRS